ncbi:MAG: L,D-transpeptidase family protein [Lamprobacter sp.]|uniref:L,D-transpeptidase family protein n=1 Tax=Lamprobacter sp. TaxID=3100796 RepID=UPI002B259AD3|nr:L,D-transpeptidase family protein [Lamprobacter sp.]MEA3641932.1 L,D-transpeptidase family protein [Lamprobacter sp.]
MDLTALAGWLARFGLTVIGVLGLSASVAAMSVLPGCGARQAIDAPALAVRPSAPLLADEVLVKKGQRRLYLMRDGKPFRTYRISLGFAPEGHKEREGDGRTPEGRYLLDWRNANSRFTKAINISYPNAQDRARAAARGDRPGGAIMIHGEPRRRVDPALADLVRYEDWTEGCVAVSNLAIEEIWRYTLDGTPIEIRP